MNFSRSKTITGLSVLSMAMGLLYTGCRDASPSAPAEERPQGAQSALGIGGGGGGSSGGSGNPDKVFLCHIPPGNPANQHSISVGASAVPAHLAHGDLLGACVTLPVDTVPPNCGTPLSLITENWDTFNPLLWRGSGDQATGGGFFFAQEGAYSAAADWIQPAPVSLETNHAAIFSNTIRLESPSETGYAQSGALFVVNADTGETFLNFVFINVGYTLAPSRVFIELFGVNGGVDFDQFEETSLAYAPGLSFDVELWVLPGAYQVGVNGQMVDTVHLNNPLTSLGLFEVGVQQNPGGLRGLIDKSRISTFCQAETVLVNTAHTQYRNKKTLRMGAQGRTRNALIREAKEKIAHTAHPSKSMRILATMNELPE